MDQEAFYDLGNFNPNEVDLNAVPLSAEAYLRQVKVSRIRLPQVVTVTQEVNEEQPNATTSKATDGDEPVKEEKKKKERDPLLPSAEWLNAKSEEFERQRKRIAELIIRQDFQKSIASRKWQPSKYIEDLEPWHAVLLENYHSKFSSLQASFPNHAGTPPALPVVASLYSFQVDSLIEAFVDWATEESLTRPIREWLYALLLFVERPPLPDVVTSLRSLVRLCKQSRKALGSDREEEIRELSLFVLVVSRNFGQSDLADE